MDGLPIRGVMWLVGLVIFNAIVEAMVTAFESVSESAVEKRLEEGDKKAKRVTFLLEHHRRYITVTDMLRLVAVSGMAVVYYVYFLPYFKVLLQKSFGADCPAILTIAVLVLITLLAVMLIELFAVKLPKKLAFKHAEGFSFALAGLLRLFVIVLGPVAWLIETITIGILKLFHIKASELEEVVTEEELFSTVEEAAESGVLEADEVEMIQNIFEFDDKEVKDIMTHRTGMVAVDADWNLEEAMKFMLNEIYSRFPVYEESVENIIGIVHLKDALKVYMSGNAAKMKQRKVRSITRKPFFVPDTQGIDVLLENMQKKKFHMALAIDEYGQTAGLVTLEDILEEIVGDIQDEYDREEEDMVSEAENVYLVKGITTLADLSEDMGHEITSEDFETLNGLIVSALGHIPTEGEQFTMTYQGCQIDIVEVKNKMVTLARVTVLPEEEASEEEEE
ncbi:MAG: HlyC/CorC family transporter [Lachnospiraceae bacterium]|nr:HlyC/CorC family transporter [Lachnospiraceae bacterium]